MDKNKIVITSEIITNAITKGRTVTDCLAEAYAGEIDRRIGENESLRQLDAFQFAMMDAGVNSRTPIGKIYEGVKASGIYQTNDNEFLFPVFIDRRLREKTAELNILPYLVGTSQTVPGTSFQGVKLDMEDIKNKDAVRKKDIVEATDIPEATMRLAETAYTLKKRGRAVRASYESYMYMTIDMFGMHLDRIANDVAGQQVEDALEVLVVGDGNNNPTDVVNMTGTTFTSRELVKFAIQFWRKSGLPLTTLITGDDAMYEELLLMTFNLQEVNGMIAGATFNFPQAQLRELTVLYDERVPKASNGKAQLIGLNREQALTKYIAAGSQIREYDRNIKNQTHLGTVSEIAGFAKFNDDASLILRAK